MVSLLVTLLAIASGLSAAVLLAFIPAWLPRRLALTPRTLRKVRLRAALMTLICACSASLLHFGISRDGWFRRSVPDSILISEVTNDRYADSALNELLRRRDDPAAPQLPREQILHLTDLILTDEDRLRAAPPESPRLAWLHHVTLHAEISREQLTAWLTLQPPPFFSLPESAGDNLQLPPNTLLVARYGRHWSHRHGLPYEISALTIHEVRVNETATPHSVTHLPSFDDPALGRYANDVILAVTTIDSPNPLPDGSIAVEYSLSLFPGPHEDLGPFLWESQP